MCPNSLTRNSQTDGRKLSEPLLYFAVLSLEHAIDHYGHGQWQDRDRIFFVLHLDLAVEFALKAKLRYDGKSIVRKDKNESLGFWECLKALNREDKEIIPNKGELENLHLHRNQLQHYGGLPDDLQIEYIAATAFSFEPG